MREEKELKNHATLFQKNQDIILKDNRKEQLLIIKFLQDELNNLLYIKQL
jgi:hypothetical protein